MSIIPYTTGNFPVYRFYVSETSSVSYEVFPLNFLSSLLEDSPEGDQIYYRRKFTGSLTFGTNSKVIDEHGITQNRRDDWQFFWDQERHDPCAKLFFTITKNSVNIPYIAAEIYWEGYFSTIDGKFDIDNCTFEVSPLTIDDYTDLLAEADTQYNILSVRPVVSTTAYIAGHRYITYTRNRWLLDVIEYLADKVITGVIVSSDFFTNPVNPVSLGTNYLQYLTIAQKSDIVTPLSSNAATSAMMSWNELTDILWGMFQVKWNYDGVNTINVEHISWFTSGAGIDLRTQLACVATNKYSYLKEKMPKYEKFSFMEADELNFVCSNIWYDSACVDQNPDTNVKETSVNVTTDLEYIINDPTRIGDEGFVILANYLDGGNYYVALQPGEYIPTVRLNMHLSWANLQYFYFRHNRILLTGYMNAVLRTFVSAQKTKNQKCSAIICDDFDPSEEITTELGETYFGGEKAQVQKAGIKPDGTVSLSLLYGPVDNANSGVIPLKVFVVVQQNTCMDWEATFPEAINQVGGIDINVRRFQYDSTHALRCTTTEIWNVPNGSRTGSFTITPCLAMNAGDYLDISFPPGPAMHGWTADVVYNSSCTY